jgi:uroporphyrinogen-III synthase
MLHIEACQASADLAGAQALLFTSANGVRAFAAQTRARDLPALCVGEATAEAARKAGFADVRAADGDVDVLAQLVADDLDPKRGALIHAAGAHVAGDLAGLLQARGFSTERRIFYEATAVERFPDDVLARLCADPPALDIVLFHSARGAQIFCALAQDAAPNACRGLTAACLSQIVANAASVLPWQDLVVAAAPRDEALIAAALGQPRPRP